MIRRILAWAICYALTVGAFVLMAGCGGGGSGEAVAKPPTTTAVAWEKQRQIDGICCNYAPFVIQGDVLRVYSNSNNGADGDYWLREGTLEGVAEPVRVLHLAEPADTYIRTSGVVVDSRGNYFALLWTGSGYPTTNGYSPSWAMSPDGRAWTWHGNVSPVGRSLFSSSNALVLNEERTDAYRFMSWTDMDGGLRMLHSADGMTWVIDPTEVLPPELATDVPVFPTATRTPFGYHLIYSNNWPATAHRHLWSCDGRRWRVLEFDAPIKSSKGTNLAYDAGVVHSIIGGAHSTFIAKAFPC